MRARGRGACGQGVGGVPLSSGLETTEGLYALKKGYHLLWKCAVIQ